MQTMEKGTTMLGKGKAAEDGLNVETMNNTDHADRYLDPCGVAPVDFTDRRVYISIPMLEFLWGRPWNNVAVNYVMALRPSSVRATSGCVTADASSWRVTVYLEKDERTIRRIEQEVVACGAGCRYGADLMLHKEGFVGKAVLGESDFPHEIGGIVNIKAVKKLGELWRRDDERGAGEAQEG